MKTQLLLFFSVCFFNVFAQDGTFDTSFNPPFFNNTIRSVDLQSDGKILVGGYFTFVGGQSRKGMARLDSNGALDASFIPYFNTYFNVYINKVYFQNDGKIIVLGDFRPDSSDISSLEKMVRLNPDGSKDETFSLTFDQTGAPSCVYFEPDGKMLVAGTFRNLNGSGLFGGLARINSLGQVDASFYSGNGLCTLPNFGGLVGVTYSIERQNDGKYLLGGSILKYDNNDIANICRINNDGSYDASFGGFGADDSVLSISTAPDGNYLISGFFDFYDTVSRNKMGKINNQGNLIADFLSYANNNIRKSIPLEDGKVIVVGDFTTYFNNQRRIVRTLSNGSTDDTFVSGAGFDNVVTDAVVQTNGKIICIGSFTDYGGYPADRIARINNSVAPFLATASYQNSVPVVQLAPNPTNNVFVISSNQTIDSIKVINLLGQTIIEQNQLQVDLSAQPVGVYMVEISSGSQKTIQKVFKN